MMLLEKYYEFAPQNARPRLVQIYLAQARSSPDQMEQLALYEKVLAIEPGSSDALDGRQKILEGRGLAQIEELQQQKRYAEAVPLLRDLSEADNARPAIFFLLATSYDHLRDYPNALSSYEKFLEVSQNLSPDQEWQARQRIKLLRRTLRK